MTFNLTALIVAAALTVGVSICVFISVGYTLLRLSRQNRQKKATERAHVVVFVDDQREAFDVPIEDLGEVRTVLEKGSKHLRAMEHAAGI